MTEEITVEIVPAELGLELTAKNTVELAFRGFFNQAEEWKAKAAAITDPKEARIARLEMKNLRVSVEKKHKEIKADALLFGRAVDGAKNIFLSIAKPIEDSLEDIEKAAEREAAAALEAIRIERLEKLAAISHDPLGIDLAGLTQAQWEAYLIQATDAAIARKQREEQARIEAEAKAAAEAAEREAARLENIRLKEEAAKREAEIQAERAAAAKAAAEAEAKAAKERAAAKAKADKEREEANAKIMAAAAEKAKLEAEAQALRDAEAKRIADDKAAAAAKSKAEAQAAKKAAAAPDKAKLEAFARTFAEINAPEMKSDEGKTIAGQLNDRLDVIQKWIHEQAATL